LLYYSSPRGEFVREFYSVFTNQQFKTRFKVAVRHPDGTMIDDQGRLWESFGYPIPLYDEDE